MDTQELPQDFKEFLKLLNEKSVDYLLIGGFAVGYYGYPRATADLDVWIAISPENAQKMVEVIRQFGIESPDLTADLFQRPGNIIRMGVAPVRIEVLNEIDGVSFANCYKNRRNATIDGQPVNLISLRHLRRNKKAAGRHKDLDDLEHLPRKET
jgi:predicted nucleotidyltransferase